MTVPVTLFSLLGEGEEGVEIAPALHQLVKAAALDDAAALESQDEVAAPEQRGVQIVSDDYAGQAVQREEGVRHLPGRRGVEGGVGLVREQQLAAPEQAARYRDALALPAGEGGAVLAAKGQRAALRNERREAGELYGPGDLLLREGAEHG